MIVFIILHYLSQEMTEECISKIEGRFRKEDIKIVVVDNASPNGSGKRLKYKYKNNPTCEIILNEKNLGFANGNNVGYQYVKKHYSPEFVVVLNNDILIEDEGFIDKIRKIYKETEFDVLGPDILAIKTGIHQNPMRIKPYSKIELKNIISERQRWLAYYNLHYVEQYVSAQLKVFVKKLIHWKSKDPEYINPLHKEKRIENPVLHGSCLVFSNKFVKNEEIAFNPHTFLYMEEDILYYTCRKKNYKLLYDSGVRVKHLEDVSTNLEFKSDYRKRKMKYTCLIQSAQVLIRLMEED